MPALVISLDFELFWGVSDSKTLDNYGANIEGVWQSVPGMLSLFKKYNIHATWATVGMLMCKDFKQWCELRPTIMPKYKSDALSTYSVAALAREFPKLFFAPTLVKQIMETEGQELASHTYSHYYCGEETSTVEQFLADLECARIIFSEYNITPTSLVFPRNQIRDEYLDASAATGFTAYRGNQDHWLYRNGHFVLGSYGKVMPLLRLANNYLPLTGNHYSLLPLRRTKGKPLNIPTSFFFRPITGRSFFDNLQNNRIKRGLLETARTNSVYHLWWHPHNFGRRTEANLKNLESILQYFKKLQNDYGMESLSMNELAGSY